MVKKGTCGLCQGGCAVVYTIENGKIEEHWYQIFFMGRSASNVH